MRDNPWHVPGGQPPSRRRTGLRVATLVACLMLIGAVGIITSALISEPEPAEVTAIELPDAATPTPTPTPTATATPRKRRRAVPTATPTASPTPAPGGFAPPPDDDPDDDPFDDDDDDDGD
jgi:hypothetical protein